MKPFERAPLLFLKNRELRARTWRVSRKTPRNLLCLATSPCHRHHPGITVSNPICPGVNSTQPSNSNFGTGNFLLNQPIVPSSQIIVELRAPPPYQDPILLSDGRPIRLRGSGVPSMTIRLFVKIRWSRLSIRIGFERQALPIGCETTKLISSNPSAIDSPVPGTRDGFGELRILSARIVNRDRRIHRHPARGIPFPSSLFDDFAKAVNHDDGRSRWWTIFSSSRSFSKSPGIFVRSPIVSYGPRRNRSDTVIFRK